MLENTKLELFKVSKRLIALSTEPVIKLIPALIPFIKPNAPTKFLTLVVAFSAPLDNLLKLDPAPLALDPALSASLPALANALATCSADTPANSISLPALEASLANCDIDAPLASASAPNEDNTAPALLVDDAIASILAPNLADSDALADKLAPISSPEAPSLSIIDPAFSADTPKESKLLPVLSDCEPAFSNALPNFIQLSLAFLALVALLSAPVEILSKALVSIFKLPSAFSIVDDSALILLNACFSSTVISIFTLPFANFYDLLSIIYLSS